MIVIKPGGQRQQFVEHPVAQVHHNLVADPADRISADERGDAAHEKNQQDDQRRKSDHGIVLVDKSAVQHGLQQSRQQRFGCCGDCHRDDG